MPGQQEDGTEPRRSPSTGDRFVAPGGQQGFSLIEVVVAVAIAAFLMLALSSGVLFLIRTNDSLEQQQQLQRVLGNLSESVKALPYSSCDDLGVGPANVAPAPGVSTADSSALASEYADELAADGTPVIEQVGTGPGGEPIYQPADDWRPVDGLTVEIVKVEFWQKVTFAAPATTVPGPGAFVADCPFERSTNGALVTAAGQPVVHDDGAQLITLRAHLGDRTATAEVIKADRRDVDPAAGP